MAMIATPAGQTCPHCSAATPLGARFCGACGSRLSPETQPAPQGSLPIATRSGRHWWGLRAAVLALLSGTLALSLLAYLDQKSDDLLLPIYIHDKLDVKKARKFA